MPEVTNLRASDDDADSQAARTDIPGGGVEDVAEILRKRVPTADDPPPARDYPRDPPPQQPPGYQYPQQPPYQGPPQK
jgi:hypothetical protein